MFKNKKLLLILIVALVLVVGVTEVVKSNKRDSLRNQIDQAIIERDSKVVFGLTKELRSQESMFSFMNSSADYGKKEMCAILEKSFEGCINNVETEGEMKACDAIFDKWLKAKCDELDEYAEAY